MIKFKMRLCLYIFVEILIMRKELILMIIAYIYWGLNMRQVVFYLLFFSLNILEMRYCIIPVSQTRKLRHYQSSNSSSDQSYLLQKTVGQPAYTDLNWIFKMPGMSSSMWMLKSFSMLVFAAEDWNQSVKFFSEWGELAQSDHSLHGVGVHWVAWNQLYLVKFNEEDNLVSLGENAL